MSLRVAVEADRLLAAGHSDAAVALVKAAVRDGDTDAAVTLATWQLIGNPVPRDLAAARRLLCRAAAAGQVTALNSAAALLANGSGGAVDWHAARIMVERGAALDPALAEQARILAAMELDDDGAPIALPAGEPLATAPAITRYYGLLTRDECRVVAETVQDMLRPAMVIDPASGRMIANPVRTSFEAVVGPTRENLVVRAINLRLAALTTTDVAQGEALTVLRYAPGQEFRPHLDSLPGTRNQRIATVLIYLNDGFGGGETVFPDVGVRIGPRIGDAIVFANVMPDGRPDPRTRHAGLSVTNGVKWLATRWIRARPFDVWSGPES